MLNDVKSHIVKSRNIT